MPEEQHTNHTWYWVMSGLALAIAAGLFAFQFILNTRLEREKALVVTPIASQYKTQQPPKIGTVGAVITTGSNATMRADYPAAIAAYETVMNNPHSTPDNKAYALLTTVGARYQHSGKIEDYMKDIEEMKAIAADPRVSKYLRAYTLNTLGGSFCRSGREWEVFETMYAGSFMSQFLVAGDPDSSSKNVFMYAYELQQTSKAAIKIARWHAEEAVANTKLTDAKVAEHIVSAREYLDKAAELEAKEVARLKDTKNSPDHITYLYWRAYVYGMLALTGTEPYKSSYDEAFAEFFRAVGETDITQYSQTVPFAHLYFARALMNVDKDADSAQKEITALINSVGADTNQDMNLFRTFVRNESPRKTPSADALREMSEEFPIFDRFVKGILREDA